MLYDLAVNRRVCGSVDADGKMYAAGAAKRRTILCCPMGVVCFIFCVSPTVVHCDSTVALQGASLRSAVRPSTN